MNEQKLIQNVIEQIKEAQDLGVLDGVTTNSLVFQGFYSQ